MLFCMSIDRARPRGITRRSLALPETIVSAACEAAPPELAGNFNRLVRVALEEYVRHRRERALQESLERMARDPAIRALIATRAGEP